MSATTLRETCSGFGLALEEEGATLTAESETEDGKILWLAVPGARRGRAVAQWLRCSDLVSSGLVRRRGQLGGRRASARWSATAQWRDDGLPEDAGRRTRYARGCPQKFDAAQVTTRYKSRFTA